MPRARRMRSGGGRGRVLLGECARACAEKGREAAAGQRGECGAACHGDECAAACLGHVVLTVLE